MKALIPILIGLLVVGCGKKKESPTAVEITDPIVEKAIREVLGRRTGQLYDADLKGLYTLYFNDNQLTDIPKGLEKLPDLMFLDLRDNQLTDVDGLEKLTQLTQLNLFRNSELTKTQIAELQKALPKCKIFSNPTK
jgi:Leucine-rich repeat (LRR) protein